jgi:hypothetical protein
MGQPPTSAKSFGNSKAGQPRTKEILFAQVLPQFRFVLGCKKAAIRSCNL